LPNRLSVLAFALAAAITAGACGSSSEESGDDDSGGSGGAGRSAEGAQPPGTAGKGASSSGGSGNAGDSSGTGGLILPNSGGSNAGSTSSMGPRTFSEMGAPCSADVECGSDYVCIAPESTAFVGGAPPGGMCSRTCTDDVDCGTTGLCVAFDEEATITYCLETCELGANAVPKCHGRADFSCSVLGLDNLEGYCESSQDCAIGQLCDPDLGVCGDIVPACVPTCAGDFDCPPGRHCDFASGLCSDGTATGTALGKLCDPKAEPDPCNGFCIPTDASGYEGVCTALCSINPDAIGCGWDGTSTAEAGCLFVPIRPPSGDPGRGDVALCGGLCDCNDDCPAHTDRCLDETGGEVMSIWGRRGYCRPLASDESENDSFACD
jgi:hypothetical protein